MSSILSLGTPILSRMRFPIRIATSNHFPGRVTSDPIKMPPTAAHGFASVQKKKYFNAMRNIQHQKRLLSNGEGVFLTGLAKAENIVKDEETEQRRRV